MFEQLKALWEEILEFGFEPEPRKRKGAVVPIAPQSVGRRILVEKTSMPYWVERGWNRIGQEYHGHYKTRLKSCQGKIKVSPAGYCTIFIHSPPPEVERHPKWVCFHRSKGDWYRVHTVRECKDVSSAIFEIEKIISESYA